MNTLPGLASKGEKGKSKYQSLDINSLYRVSRGESLEPHQQKSTLPRKHGMQSLGKVPSARRPPANLPSLKSEHSGSDAAVSLVPSGGPGWGKQDANSTTTTAPAPPSTPTNSNTITVAATTSPPAATTTETQIAQPAPSPNKPQQQQIQPSPQPPPPPKIQTPPPQQLQQQQQQQHQQQQQQHQQQQQQAPVPQPSPSLSLCPLGAQPAVVGAAATDNKSWSAIMTGTDILQHPPPYQSPQFQHEFPSLSASGVDGPAPAGAVTPRDVQYGPGPSLRPQTEGSWMQGGSRSTQSGGDQPAVVKSSSAPLTGPPQLLGPAGPNGVGGGPAAAGGVAVAVGVAAAPAHIMQQFRGVAPPFMFRGNFQQQQQANGAVSNFSAMTNPLTGRGPPGRFPAPGEQQQTQQQQRQQQQQQQQMLQQQQQQAVRNNQAATEIDEVTPRPIIKEEDLNRMDDMTRDVGWASHDDIDYNQKLAFSDDDIPGDHDRRKEHMLKKEQERMEATGTLIQPSQDIRNSGNNVTASRGWGPRPTSVSGGNGVGNSQPATPQTNRGGGGGGGGSGGNNGPPGGGGQMRSIEDEEWNQRRRQHSEEVAIAVERAKIRKEEEEKRFNEQKQAAAKKLLKLEEKIKEKKGVENKENDETQGTINPSTVPPQPITPVPIPVPEWERDRENRERSRTPNDTNNKHNEFHQLTQIEGRSFINKTNRTDREISRERDIRGERDRAGPFSHFQSNLPPRFQKQQAERTSTNYHRNGGGTTSGSGAPSTQQQQQQNVPFAQQYEPRWVQNTSTFPGKSQSAPIQRKRDDGFDDERRRERGERSYPESMRKISSGDYDDYRNYRRENSQEYEFKRDRDDERERHYEDPRKEEKEEHEITRQDSGEWHREGRKEWEGHRDEIIQQRPDSRDSRISKELDYSGNWADTPFEFTEDKKNREERRIVPGPITKEKIEADDMKNEKRHLIQLKRIDLKDKKTDDKEKKIDDAWSLRKKDDAKVWDVSSTQQQSDSKFMEALEKGNKKSSSGDSLHKTDSKDTKKSDDSSKDDKHQGGAGRIRAESARSHRNQWQGGYSVYGSSWSKRGGGNMRAPPRSAGHRPRDWHATDSELSGDEVSVSTESGKEDRRHPKPTKKTDKDEKNKDLKQDKTSDRNKYDKRYDSTRNSRESFVPRGEPSRHGRGGFRGSRSITSKRIDGYGIPPSKSPFGNQHEDKDKKSGDEIGGEVISSDEKTKLNQQQALSAGIIGSSRNQKSDPNRRNAKTDDKMSRHKTLQKKPHNSDAGEECWETTSENSDTENERKDKRKKSTGRINPSAYNQGLTRQSSTSGLNRPNQTRPEKRNNFTTNRQNITSNIRSVAKPTTDIKPDSDAKKSQENDLKVDDQPLEIDADGFQEVRSKKTVKDRQKIEEKPRSGKPDKQQKPKPSPAAQLTPQQIASIPPLLGTPVNPPTMMNTGNKMSFERPRQNKLPPRLAKQRENNRLQKAQMQQGMCDVNEMNKINQNVSMYNLKEAAPPAPVPVVNAWEKPITSQLRNDDVLGIVENCAELEQTQQSSTSSQRSSPSNDKINKAQDKAVLDGATPPVNTIIFENTNYKSAPVNHTDLAVKSKFTNLKTREKSRNNKMDDADVDSSVFNKPIQDILNKSDSKPDPIQMPLSFKTEDNADMKLDFTFDSDLSQLTDDKSSKSLGLPRSMHAITSSQSTISPSTAELNLKIASVKKVWETTMPTVLEHNVVADDSVTSTSASFSSTFGPDPNTLDHSNAFSKAETPDDNHEGYSPSPSQSCTSNNTTNVCKVKPTQQLAGSGQVVHSVSTHHAASQHPGAVAGQHSAMVGQNLIGHPISPPPMQQVLGASVGLGQPPQQYTNNQHINYQASLGGNAQYGSMSAIPSPPTVLFNSTQQMPTQGGLYGFQMDQSQVLNSQGRSQYSQYPNPYGLGQTASSPYSAQSMYLQTAPPHPPPSAQPPPDLYQSISSQYRMAATGPFGQSQQLTNNPSTVLISTTSNSLMSATVKPSSQQISAIGTKAGTVGQAYQQQSQQQQQLYIPYDPNMQANYLSSTGVLQRGPTGPVQNSVVPGLQPSSSYYSGSAGAQTGFYQQPGNSTIQSAPLHQHQTSFGLQGNVFGTHNQSHANAGLQSFGSQFLSSQMQMAAAAALTAQQQYRSPSLPNPNYLKGVGTQHMTDQSGRSQQLKSPGANQQDVIASVFNSAPQIPSPKSRQNCKQPPPQSSPTQHKYVSAYQSVNNQQSAQIPPTRYPAPIQRPVNFQPALNSSLQNSGNVSNRHRPTHNQNSRGPSRQYYGGQGGGIPSSQSDKSDDSKLENGSTINNKVTVAATGGTNNSELGKDVKDEPIVNKE